MPVTCKVQGQVPFAVWDAVYKLLEGTQGRGFAIERRVRDVFRGVCPGERRDALPACPHPTEEPLPCGLRYVLALEPQRILSCLGFDEPAPDQEELLRVTLVVERYKVDCGLCLFSV